MMLHCRQKTPAHRRPDHRDEYAPYGDGWCDACRRWLPLTKAGKLVDHAPPVPHVVALYVAEVDAELRRELEAYLASGEARRHG